MSGIDEDESPRERLAIIENYEVEKGKMYFCASAGAFS